MKIFNRKEQKDKRSSLRLNTTNAEYTLWQHLRKSQLGYKFRRQHGVGIYILDFYCPKAKLAIEIDGDSHYEQGQTLKDKVRTSYLKEFEISIVRFTNQDIYHNLEEVISKIKKLLE